MHVGSLFIQADVTSRLKEGQDVVVDSLELPPATPTTPSISPAPTTDTSATTTTTATTEVEPSSQQVAESILDNIIDNVVTSKKRILMYYLAIDISKSLS